MVHNEWMWAKTIAYSNSTKCISLIRGSAIYPANLPTVIKVCHVPHKLLYTFAFLSEVSRSTMLKSFSKSIQIRLV